MTIAIILYKRYEKTPGKDLVKPKMKRVVIVENSLPQELRGWNKLVVTDDSQVEFRSLCS